ncbi:unnamed protein product [Arctia plantaginis]|uniref:Uncharacterized protein n=1 Tax=Arctia plantaginis TaxID=874455 RepID=A0A8S0ZZ51_ARCPL|nr:unnamed protein product [Arctia plantaginis]CAB3239266.1 unnamed protein product [Arctia plantaginis]
MKVKISSMKFFEDENFKNDSNIRETGAGRRAPPRRYGNASGGSGARAVLASREDDRPPRHPAPPPDTR